MKDQYFGDVNDYRKYGLLRALQSEGTGRLLVAWMLTPDDGGPDGNRRAYIGRPEEWAHFDPALYAGLVALLPAGVAPRVALLEPIGLLPRASFFSAAVPDARAERDDWRDALLKAAAGMDLVFLDPDNGLEVPSRPVGRKGSSKYVTWQEIEELWAARCSLLLYQHFRREPYAAFAARMSVELQRRTGASFVQAFRTPHVLFLLVAQARHVPVFRRVIAHPLPRWAGQIGVLGNPSC